MNKMQQAVTFCGDLEKEPKDLYPQFSGQIPPLVGPGGPPFYQNLPISQSAVDRLVLQEQEFCQTQVLLQKREEERRRTELQKIEARQRIKEKNESQKLFQRLVVYDDRAGKLWLEVNGAVRAISELTEAHSFTVRHYIPAEAGFADVYELAWQGREQKRVYFSGTDFCPGNVMKILEKCGVVFSVTSHLRKPFSAVLFEYFLRNEVGIMLPVAYGWQMLDGKWRYITNDEMLMADIDRRSKNTGNKISNL